MATQNKKPVGTGLITMLATQALMATVYGRGLWSKVQDVCNGKATNTSSKPLAADVDINSLASPAMYYQRNKFGDLQMLVKFSDREWAYAGIIRDKEGEPILSDEHNYTIREVSATSTYPVPGSDHIIQIGDIALKAYAEEEA